MIQLLYYNLSLYCLYHELSHQIYSQFIFATLSFTTCLCCWFLVSNLFLRFFFWLEEKKGETYHSDFCHRIITFYIFNHSEKYRYLFSSFFALTDFLSSYIFFSVIVLIPLAGEKIIRICFLKKKKLIIVTSCPFWW